MEYQNASMPHTGIATFCKAPLETKLDKVDADIAVLGIPYDGATAMRPGSRQAPRAIRDASGRFGFLGKEKTNGFYDINRNKTFLKDIKLVDCGDVDIMYFKEQENLLKIKNSVTQLLNKNCLPVILGGDHSISYPVLSAYEKFEPLTVILFDAHLDYRNEIAGLKLTNNSPFRRAYELGFIKQIINFGIRGIKSTEKDIIKSREHGHLIFSNYDIFDNSLASIMSKIPEDIGNYYISIDIDGLDPSIAPGTESPEAEGLSFRDVKQIGIELSKRGNLVGLDLVEVNPYLDHSELTQHIAVQLLIEVMATKFE